MTEYIGDDIFLRLIANIINKNPLFEIDIEEATEQYDIDYLYNELIELNPNLQELARYIASEGFIKPWVPVP